VIAYHVHAAWLPGGYLGVDVFFGISGFLITYLLVAEHGRRGRIALRGFWRRRAVRLLPELLLVLPACAVTARLAGGGGTGLGDGLRGDALASLLFCGNWWQIHQGADYFHHLGTPPLLQHLWSLSVEEQFYLVWPVLLALCLRLVRPVRGRRRSWPAAALGVAALGGAAASLWRMHALAGHGAGGVSRAYFGTDAHSGALLAGCAAALLLPALRRVADRLPRRGLTPFCLALGVLAVFAATGPGDATMYGWGFAAVAAATAVVCAGCAAGTPVRLLDAAPLRLIGRHSYGLYLWHWPVVVTLDALWPAAGPAGRALAVLVPLPLAVAGQRLVLRPVASLLGRSPAGGGRSRLADGRSRAGDEPSLVADAPSLAADERSLVAPGPSARVLGARSRGVRARRAVPVAAVAAAAGVLVLSPASAPSALQRQLQAAERYEAGLGADDSPAHAGSAARGGGPDGAGPGGPHTMSGAGSPPDAPTGAAAPPDGAGGAGAGADQGGGVPAGGADGSDVTMIGDSLSLGSSPDLHRLLPGIDLHAEVGRMMESAPDLCARLLAAHRLRGTVVLALGTNAEFGADVLDDVRAVIGARRMVLMTVRGPFPWQDEVNAVVRAYHRDHPEVVVDDWYAAAQSHQDLLWIDHTHPRGGAGTALFAGRLAASLTATR
jgi:peptidoglycan/LPS O-acetylase OafA/YrhL